MEGRAHKTLFLMGKQDGMPRFSAQVVPLGLYMGRRWQE